MKIGIDYHGVIDAYPDLFSKWSEKWVSRGYEVHILTGRGWDYVEPKVGGFKIKYTHHFSIVDYHKEKGTAFEEKSSGIWMDSMVWDESKGRYCEEQNISVLFDNDLKYAAWLPDTCSFVWVRKKNFERFFSVIDIIK